MSTTPFLALGYVAAAVTANLLVTDNPELSPYIAFFFIGFILVVRDRLHERLAATPREPLLAGRLPAP